MQIINSTLRDLPAIMSLYGEAIAHQKAVSNLVWKGFDEEVVVQEIRENRQWKIMVEDEMACVFMTAYNDPAIWDEKDRDSAIYVHRIVTNPKFRGKGFVQIITDWAIQYAHGNNLDFVRLDTWQDNAKLHQIYQKAGFRYVGIKSITPTHDLPKHYWGTNLGLFEIKLLK